MVYGLHKYGLCMVYDYWFMVYGFATQKHGQVIIVLFLPVAGQTLKKFFISAVSSILVIRRKHIT